MAGTVFRKTISMTLDPGSIENAIKELNQFKEDLKRAMQGLVEYLMESGVTHAKLIVSAMDAVDTGTLMASIGHGAFDPESRTGIIYAGRYYAAFVEFGTGIVGKASPHPGIAAGEVGKFAVLGENGSVYSDYDTNGHGEKGWVYRPVGSNRYFWTQGMPARPFMYETYKSLEEIAKKFAGDIIAEYVW